MDNLFPFDLYEPVRTKSRGGRSWPRPPEIDPYMFREPGYSSQHAKRPQRPRSTPPATSNKTKQRDGGFAKDSEKTPGTRKVKTIPVRDAGIPSHKAPQGAPLRILSRFENANTAATKIQAAFRGYSVRRTDPLKYLRSIYKVRSELKVLVHRIAEPEQFGKLCLDPQERLKWTECVMALLLRLDSIQGVHPVVREVRKSVSKEVIQLQEIIDSTSKISYGEEEGGKVDDGSDRIEEVTDVENVEDERELTYEKGEALVAKKPEDDLAVSGLPVMIDAGNEPLNEKSSELREDEAEEGTAPQNSTELEPSVTRGSELVTVERNIVEDSKSESLDSEPTKEMEVSNESPETTTTTSASTLSSNSAVESSSPEVEEGRTEEEGTSIDENVVDSQNDIRAARDAQEDVTVPEAIPGDVQGEATVIKIPVQVDPAVDLEGESDEYFEAKDQYEFSMERPDRDEAAKPGQTAIEVQGVDTEERVSDNIAKGLGSVSHTVPALAEITEHDLGAPAKATADKRIREATEVAALASSPFVDANCVEYRSTADALQSTGEQELGNLLVDVVDGHERALVTGRAPYMDSLILEPCRHDFLQISESDPSTSEDVPLSDQELMQRILKENLKLKAVIGEVLQWGKQQNDIIHNLATRIEQLEGGASDSNRPPNGTSASINRISSSYCQNDPSSNRKRVGYLDNKLWASSSQPKHSL